MKTVTITTNAHREIVALDGDGNRIASRSRYCNPNALAQLVCDVELAGCTIDWDGSTVAKPEN